MNKYIPEPTYEISYLFRDLLVPFDGKEHSVRALEVALDFSLRYGSRITILYIRRPGEPREEAEKILKKAEELAKKREIEVKIKIREMSSDEDTIAGEILRELSEKIYNAVIIGSRGKTCVDALVHGSTTTPIALCAPCTVIIVR